MLKTLTVLGLSASLVASLGACTTTDPYTGQTVRDNTRTGVAAGAAGGAILGYLTNTNSGRQGRRNALIGAGIGALAGGLVGNYMDRQQAELRRELNGSGVSVSRYGDALVLNMPGDVTFGFNSAVVEPRFTEVLDAVATTLNRYPATYIDVVGHTDSVGSEAYNLSLSEKRATAVADQLAARHVIPQRIYVLGRGELDPIAPNETDAGRAANRRVEIVLRPHTQG